MITKLAGTFALALALTPAAAAAASAQPGAAVAKPDWIISQSAIPLLEGAGLKQGQVQVLFGNSRTYLVRPATGTAPVSGAVRTTSFTDYNALAKAITTHSLPAGTKAVLYDDEAWSFTPKAQQKQPAEYEKLGAQLAHAHHLLFIAAPAVDLVKVLDPTVTSDYYTAYLTLGLAASAARYSDAVDIQAQGSITNLTKYQQFVQAAAAQARKANRHVSVIAGLSTNPSGQHVTAGEFSAAFYAVRPYVNGYWVNIPAGGAYCPKCGTPKPGVAVPLLRSLAG
jgi:hypothetical protein